jgi:hypothetical protein
VVAGLPRGLLVAAVWLVLAFSLGRSGVFALVNLIASATAPGPLRRPDRRAERQPLARSAIAGPVASAAAIGFGLAPALLVIYLVVRSGHGVRTLGVDGMRARRDAV